ncbi:MAG: radical SAM protein [Candidatus Thorarchaeota archaeon]
MVEYVRLSLGTAITLGIEKGPKLENFTTAFIMTYNEDGCIANCAFCPQARGSTSDPELLSRIGWPKYSMNEVTKKLESSKFNRTCIQSLNYFGVVDDIISILNEIRLITKNPISTCIHPVPKKDMVRLKDAGIDNIGIAIDASTPVLFDKIKGKSQHGPYSWKKHMVAIEDAQSVFGNEFVTTHLIIGLGETEKEAAEFLIMMKTMGIKVALFAFTSIKGTSLENKSQPDLGTYRRIQVLRYLLFNDLITVDRVSFEKDGAIKFGLTHEQLVSFVANGEAFQTSGCTGCNRPYYNERPSGPMYNYPRSLSPEEVLIILEKFR